MQEQEQPQQLQQIIKVEIHSKIITNGDKDKDSNKAKDKDSNNNNSGLEAIKIIKKVINVGSLLEDVEDTAIKIINYDDV